MIDTELRSGLRPLLRPLACRVAAAGVRAHVVTATGLVLGVGCLVAVAADHLLVGLGLWLANRLADGLDGEVARIRGEQSELGAWLDIVCDFAVYGGLAGALAIAHPEARLALVALLVAYYLNGSAFLALSASLERRGRTRPDDRGFHFRRSLTEGGETVAAGVLFLLLPQHLPILVWGFAGLVAISFGQRVADAVRLLRE